MIESEWIPCKTCGNPTTFLGTKLCNGCWEVQTRLLSYLNNKNAIQFVLEALNKAKQATPPDPQHGRESDKVKPLAQYLFEHDCEYADVRSSYEYFQQALDAYENTEQVKIRIERV